MVFLCFIWFLVLYFCTYKFAKSNDLFSPLKFISIKFAVTNLPFILFIAFKPGSFVRNILKVCNVTIQDAFLQYTIVQTIAFACLVAGVVIFNKKPIVIKGAAQDFNYKKTKLLAWLFFLTGFSAYCIFLYRIGGLGYLLNNMDKRIELQSGQYVLVLLPLMSIGVLLLLCCLKIKNALWDKILFAFFVALTIFTYSSFGARKNTILFIITLIVAFHYIIKPLKITLKSGAVAAVLLIGLLVYIFVIPEMRLNNGNAIAVQNNKNISLNKLMYNTSYTYIDVFAANYFDKENAWYFKGFLAPAIVPFSKVHKSKLPQIDQGVYFTSIVQNNKYYAPPLPREEVSKTSWPTENFGFAYANLLLPGIVIFFFLQGLVFSVCYRFLQSNFYNPIAIMLYVVVIFDFNFSSLRIAEFVRIVPLLIVAFFILLQVNKDEKKQL